jgi:hypothetical protein
MATAQESATDLECRLTQAQRELCEAREQQAAIAEVLRIISSSPTELQPVLEVVVKNAARFCGADDVTIFELDGQDLYVAAHWGPIPQVVGPRVPCVRGSVGARDIGASLWSDRCVWQSGKPAVIAAQRKVGCIASDAIWRVVPSAAIN